MDAANSSSQSELSSASIRRLVQENPDLAVTFALGLADLSKRLKVAECLVDLSCTRQAREIIKCTVAEDRPRVAYEVARLSREVDHPLLRLQIAGVLADQKFLEEARRIAESIRDTEDLDEATAVRLRQQWALWTSNNPDGPDDTKHDEALRILDGIRGQPLSLTGDPETP